MKKSETDFLFKEINDIEFLQNKSKIWRMVFGGDIYEYVNQSFIDGVWKKVDEINSWLLESKKYPIVVFFRNGTTNEKKYLWVTQKGYPINDRDNKIKRKK